MVEKNIFELFIEANLPEEKPKTLTVSKWKRKRAKLKKKQRISKKKLRKKKK